MDESEIHQLMIFFVRTREVVEREDADQIGRFIKPLQEGIDLLESITGGVDEKILAKCKLMELNFRRLRDRITRRMGRQWIAAQLIKSN